MSDDTYRRPTKGQVAYFAKLGWDGEIEETSSVVTGGGKTQIRTADRVFYVNRHSIRDAFVSRLDALSVLREEAISAIRGAERELAQAKASLAAVDDALAKARMEQDK